MIFYPDVRCTYILQTRTSDPQNGGVDLWLTYLEGVDLDSLSTLWTFDPDILFIWMLTSVSFLDDPKYKCFHKKKI